MNKTTRYSIIIGILMIFVGLFAWYKMTPGPYDALATCLKDQGVLFYGTFWCPHCQAQKQMFSKSASKLPYIECSTPDSKGQLDVCKDAGITNYPTWIFPDGTKITGEQEPSFLAEKTSCPLN